MSESQAVARTPVTRDALGAGEVASFSRPRRNARSPLQAPPAAPRLRVLVGVQDIGFHRVETYAEQVALAAASSGHDVTLLVSNDAIARTVRERTVGTGLRVASAKLAPAGRRQLLAERLLPQLHTRRVGLGLAAFLRAHPDEFDVLHLNRPALSPWASGVKQVCVAAWFYPHEARRRLHDTWHHAHGGLPRRLVLAFKALACHVGDVRGYQAATKVVACTETLAQQLRGKGHDAVACPPPARVTAGVGADFLRSESYELDLLICCGDLSHPRKNLADAVTVAGLLVRPGRDVVLRVIGGNADDLEQRAKLLPPGARIEFLGIKSPLEVRNEMRRADAFLLPSLYEEWGYVAVESILSGTPVATYPVYPFADMLRGGLGLVADGHEPKHLADAVERALTSRRGRMLSEVSEQRFGAQAVGRQLTKIWTAKLEQAGQSLVATG